MSTPEPSRRDRLVATAIDMFTRYGVRRTSVEDIATEARISKGAVYLEFAGKDELFRAAAEQVVAEILAAAAVAAAREASVEDRVTEILIAKFWRFYDLVHSRAHARELIEAKDATAAEVFRAADDRYAALVTRTLAEASWKVAPAEVSGVLLRTAHGTGYGAGRLSASVYRKRLALAVRLILTGARRTG